MTESIAGKKVGLRENLLSLRTLLGFAVAAAVAYIFLRNFDLQAAVSSITRAKWVFFALAIAAFYFSLPLRGARWGLLLRPTGQMVGSVPLTHYYFLSWFANTILPARIGDIYRAYLLKKNREVSISLSLGVIFSERVFDLAVTAALVLLSGTYFWALLKNANEEHYLLWGLIGTGMIVILFIVIMNIMPFVVRIAPDRWKGPLGSFHSGIFRSPSLLPAVVVMTIAIWLSEALRLYFVFLALGINAGFLVAVFISQASLILMSIPLSPSGLGLVELLMLKLLSSTGLAPSLAGAITLTDRLISYWSLLAMGAIAYFLSPRIR